MIIETNPEDEEALDNSSDNEDGLEPNNEPTLEPAPELDAEGRSQPDFIPDIEPLPRGAELRAELSPISSRTSELENLNFLYPNDLYSRSRRGELQSTLSTDARRLVRYERRLQIEAGRCQRNLDHIRTGFEKLNLEETRECYSEAQREQQKQYYDAVWDLDAVRYVLAKVQAALGSSPIRGFPVKDPFTPDLPLQPGGLSDEAEGLLSLGPLGKNAGRGLKGS